MKNIITIAFILFCIIFSLAQDNSIPSSVLKRTHQIEGGKVHGTVLLHNHAYTLVQAASDSIWLSDSLFIQKGDKRNTYLVKYDLDFNLIDVLQISGGIDVFLTEKNNELLIGGRFSSDTVLLNNQMIFHEENDIFRIYIDENFQIKSSYLFKGDHVTCGIAKNERITYLAGTFSSSTMIFRGDTLFGKVGLELGNFYILALKDEEVLWHKVIENLYLPQLAGMEIVQNDQLVVGIDLSYGGFVINQDTISFDGHTVALKFDSSSELLWDSSKELSFGSFGIYDFQKPDNLFFKGWDEMNNNSVFGCIDAKDGSLKWKKEMKGNCSAFGLQVEGNDLYMAGIYEQSLGFEDILLDSVTGNYNAFFFHYNISNSKADLYSIAGNNTDYCFGLSVDNGEILISGFSESDHLFPDEFQLDFQQNSSYLALLDMTKLTDIVEIEKNFNIFPNPIQSGDYLKIISDKTSKDSHIKIVNNLGQIVYSLENGRYFQIPKYLQSGIYYLMIEDDKRSELHKLIVE